MTFPKTNIYGLITVIFLSACGDKDNSILNNKDFDKGNWLMVVQNEAEKTLFVIDDEKVLKENPFGLLLGPNAECGVEFFCRILYKMRQKAKIVLIFLVVSISLLSQDKEIQTRIKNGELKMNFPSVYFKNNSTDYASMPYSADSCFKYIVENIKYINDLVIWRDSLETEKLSRQRIKKIKNALRKYKEISGVPIESMGKEQKISRHTIEMSTDKAQMEYLLSLNSVFEISATRFEKQAKYTNHIMRPRVWCWGCWSTAFHTKARRQLKKIEKQKKENQQPKSNTEKYRRRLVWFGWKSGFHWSSAGKVRKK